MRMTSQLLTEWLSRGGICPSNHPRSRRRRGEKNIPPHMSWKFKSWRHIVLTLLSGQGDEDDFEERRADGQLTAGRTRDNGVWCARQGGVCLIRITNCRFHFNDNFTSSCDRWIQCTLACHQLDICCGFGLCAPTVLSLAKRSLFGWTVRLCWQHPSSDCCCALDVCMASVEAQHENYVWKFFRICPLNNCVYRDENGDAAGFFLNVGLVLVKRRMVSSGK